MFPYLRAEDVSKMSEKKEVAKKAAAKPAVKGKQPFGTRMVNWFKAVPGRVANAFKNMAAELKKVSWPSRKELINYSVLVIVFVVAMAILIGLLDLGSSALVQLLVKA